MSLDAPIRLAILGSSGSVGKKAVQIAHRYADQFRVVALAANESVEVLGEQAALVHPEKIVVGNSQKADALRRIVPSSVSVSSGGAAIADLAALPEVDCVVNAIVGRAGLESSLQAARAGKRLALANKESLVLAGELLMSTARKAGSAVLPIDSEHSGLFQALEGRDMETVKKLIITASGGPFRGFSAEDLKTVSPQSALNHPVWPMGPRITIDSATLLNKGLEVIETHHLFNFPLEHIDVWVHPQSVVHALIECVDSSIIAHLSHPDMMLPIQYAMTYPGRFECDTPRLDLSEWKSLDFEKPDHEVFPALRLAYEAAALGGTAPTALNAADEVAVDAFLAGRISFPEIVDLVASVMRSVTIHPIHDLDTVIEADQEARSKARALLGAKWETPA